MFRIPWLQRFFAGQSARRPSRQRSKLTVYLEELEGVHSHFGVMQLRHNQLMLVAFAALAV